MIDSILMPVNIYCMFHDEKMPGDYNEITHRFEVRPCQKCEEEYLRDAYQNGYNEGYDDGVKDTEHEMLGEKPN